MSIRHRPEHLKVVQREFAKQASAYEAYGLTMNGEKGLRWAIEQLDLKPPHRVLDVAAGTGLLSRKVAPLVREVIALDATREMMNVGKAEAEKAGLRNLLFHEGRAERLPFPDASFDWVVTRFSIHHMAEPSRVVHEMTRVCRPGGGVAVIDLAVPDDASLAARYNNMERMRDPSHTIALSATQLRELVQGAGLSIQSVRTQAAHVPVNRWLDLTKASTEVRATIINALTGELNGTSHTGMQPVLEGNELCYRQRWVAVIGRKG